MEGVTFALRESMEILEAMGLLCERILSSGGGASSPVWLQIRRIFPQGVAGLPGKGAGMSWRVHAGGDRGWNLWGYQRGCPEPCDLRPGSLSPGSGTCGTIQETV